VVSLELMAKAQRQYKKHLSSFITWEPREHAQWIISQNMGTHLSIDEALSQGELYTIVTNKKPKARTDH
jgi:hypothetical protein